MDVYVAAAGDFLDVNNAQISQVWKRLNEEKRFEIFSQEFLDSLLPTNTQAGTNVIKLFLL
jgi:hypothetical protein